MREEYFSQRKRVGRGWRLVLGGKWGQVVGARQVWALRNRVLARAASQEAGDKGLSQQPRF